MRRSREEVRRATKWVSQRRGGGRRDEGFPRRSVFVPSGLSRNEGRNRSLYKQLAASDSTEVLTRRT